MQALQEQRAWQERQTKEQRDWQAKMEFWNRLTILSAAIIIIGAALAGVGFGFYLANWR